MIGKVHTAITSTKYTNDNEHEDKISLVSLIQKYQIKRGVNGGCLLHYALTSGKCNHVSLLHIKEIFERFPDAAYRKDKKGRTLLLCALLGCHNMQTIDFILQHTSPEILVTCDYSHKSAVHYVLENDPNNIEILIRLVSEDQRLIYMVDTLGRNVLHYAMMHKCSMTVLQFLCLFCSNVLTMQDRFRKTPLHYELDSNHNGMQSRITFLLSKTEDVVYDVFGNARHGNILSYLGYRGEASLLTYAASKKVSFETLQILYVNDPGSFCIPDKYGNTTLYHMLKEKYDTNSIIWFAALNPDCFRERHINDNSLLYIASELKYPMDVLRALCGPEGEMWCHENLKKRTPLQILIWDDADENDLNEIIMTNLQQLKRNGAVNKILLLLVEKPQYFNILQNVINTDLSIIVDYQLLNECMKSEWIETCFILDLLKKNPQSIFTIDNYKLYTPLHTLIGTGRANTTTVQIFLKYDLSQISRLNQFSRTPFQFALYLCWLHGDTMNRTNSKTTSKDVLHLLLSRYEDVVFCKDNAGNCPLHHGIHNNIDHSITRRLLELNHTQIGLMNADFLTPVETTLDWSNYKNEAYLKHLISMNPITLNHVDAISDISPLHSAICNGYSVSMVIFIVSVHGNLMDMVSDDWNTPLHILILNVKNLILSGKEIFSNPQQQRILQILSFLLDHKPSMLFANNKKQETPLQMAFSLNLKTKLRVQIAEIMISHMSKYASVYTQALLETTLHLATNNELPKKLIEKIAHLKSACKNS